ncbi:MAG: ABC transporter permease [Saprospiraceae bacterium]
MLINYLKIAWRNLLKYKLFSSINIGGLALGLTVAILIGRYVQLELGVDQWLTDGERIYRVYRSNPDGSGAWTQNSPMLAPKLVTDLPEVETATYLRPDAESLFSTESKGLYIKKICLVDSSFLTVIDLPLSAGDKQAALQAPNTMLVSEAVALRFFGTKAVVGKVLTYNGDEPYTITGVFPVINGTSHLDYEVFLRQSSLWGQWLNNSFVTYVKLRPDASSDVVAAKMYDLLSPIMLAAYAEANFEVTAKDMPTWGLQNFQEIYLHSADVSSLTNQKGNLRYLYILGFIAILVLIVAMINYINLSTARALNRSKEIGIRKVGGAVKGQLVVQFLVEAILQSLVAMIIAIPLAELVLPIFNQICGRSISLIEEVWPGLLLPCLALSLLVGGLAGLYPAFVLSGFRPIQVLSGHRVKLGGQTFRKTLVVAQFTGVVVLGVVMLVMYKQVQFMLHQDLGFNDEQVITIPLNYQESWRNVEAIKQDLINHPGIRAVSSASSFPGHDITNYTVELAGKEKNYFSPDFAFVDDGYADILGLKMVQGRFFSPEFTSDTIGGFVVNEAFVKRMQLDDPIGHKMRLPWHEDWGQIVGVVKDYHHRGLDANINPLVLFARPMYRPISAISVQAEDWQNTLSFIQEKWLEVEPAHPFRYEFLDQSFAAQYQQYQELSQTMLYSVLLTIIVAILGLLGLSTFMAQQKTKEIGIRKVLGASVQQLIVLLSSQFLWLVLIASAMAIPLAYWLSSLWLQDFAYRVDPSILPFVIAIAASLFIALLTVSIQAFRVARANPVEALRGE